MKGEHKAWLVVTLILSASLIACIAIMAQCSVKETNDQVRAAECGKHGGTWTADPSGFSFCTEPSK